MHRLTKFFGAMFAGFGAFALVCAAFAADATPRAGANARAANRAGAMNGRMPSMPIMTVNTINTTLDIPNAGQQTSVQPGIIPDSKPEPSPDSKPQPGSQCSDGGVRDSEYTVDNCMNDILMCINSGALGGGLNDLFDEDVRNAIMNGMGLCASQAEKCMTDVRRDCGRVYNSLADVWIDFNSRKVQPEYYNFVLRKTGLTPNQAENTCLLLDVNTYGSSFNAVDNNGLTTSEYNNKVATYNNHGNVSAKANPMGATLNYGNSGVDGARGHYARWDAKTATCYLRVAAYNKDKLITNTWLFGAMGDDKPAEVWRATGDTFGCNKDLFGFALKNDTKTAAVVGVGGGTVLGVGIGALAGHGKRAFDCENKSARKTLEEQLRKNKDNIYALNGFLPESDKVSAANLTESQCNAIVDLYVKYKTVKETKDRCFGGTILNCTFTLQANDKQKLQQAGATDGNYTDFLVQACRDAKQKAWNCKNFLINKYDLSNDGSFDAQCSEEISDECKFISLRNSNSLADNLKCSASSGGCASMEETAEEITQLGSIFSGVTVLEGEKSNYGKTIPVGAAIGAGAGGVATAITAFVERNNISCRVGDGLETVAFGKSHSIGTLKDFYVKWNLHLSDNVSPTATVNDCSSWRSACAQYTDLNQCKKAVLNYKPDANSTTKLIHSACKTSGSACIENISVAKSYGVCK